MVEDLTPHPMENRVEKKKQPTCFFCFKKKRFSDFFKIEKIVCFLLKTEKPHSQLFLLHHATSQFSELHNNTLLSLSWHSKSSVKKCIISLFWQSVVGQFTPTW